MTEFNVGRSKRKADDAGVGDGEGLLKRPNVSDYDISQIEGLVADVVRQLCDENAENIQGLSPGINELPQEDFEVLIWRESLTSSLPLSFPGSQEESSFTSSPTGFEFGPPEHLEGSHQVQEFGDSFNSRSPAITTPIFTGEVSRDDEDVVMNSPPAEDDNYAETPIQTDEQSPSEVEYVIDPDYVRKTAALSFRDVWEESLLAMVDISDIRQVKAERDVQKLYSDYLQDVEDFVSRLLTEESEESEDGTWKPYA